MRLFVDTSAFYAAFDVADVEHDRARAVLGADEEKVTTDHILVELWQVLQRRFGDRRADGAIERIVGGPTQVEPVGIGDLQVGLGIGEDFPDQEFSLVDRTSFAVMNRLGVSTVATFDHHFAVYRFGPGRRKSFEIAR